MTGAHGRPLTREDVKAHFGPLVVHFDEAIAAARAASTLEKVKLANPEVTRTAHLHRLAGTKRWMCLADGLVAIAPRFPPTYGVLSTDEQHNGGQYVFCFPGGVFTVKQEAHKPDEEGAYLQEAFEGLEIESDGTTTTANAKVFLSVGATGPVKLIVEHPTLSESFTVTLDELRPKLDEVPTPARPKKSPARAVRSSIKREDDHGAGRAGS